VSISARHTKMARSSNNRRKTLEQQNGHYSITSARAMRQSNVRYGQIASLWCERRFGQTDRPMQGARGGAIPTAITSEIISSGIWVPHNTARHIHKCADRRSPKTRFHGV